MTTTITGATGVNRITSDAIEYGDLPAGTILQVVETSNDNATDIATSSTTLQASGIQLSIVPKQTGSRLHIDWIGGMGYAQSGSYMYVRMYKDGVGLGYNDYSMLHEDANGGARYSSTCYTSVYTAGAAGTSVLYEPYFKSHNGGDVRIVHGNSSYILRITEVAV
jgi:hypothetical protein